MSRVVFTGTQAGMTVSQLEALEKVITQVIPASAWAAHANGLCVGADTQAFYLFTNLRPDVSIYGFPANIPWKSNLAELSPLCKMVMPVRPPLQRNGDMVVWAKATLDRPELARLIAAPKKRGEVLRSGTWSTVRRARFHRLPIIYIWPDGQVEEK